MGYYHNFFSKMLSEVICIFEVSHSDTLQVFKTTQTFALANSPV